MKIINLTQGSSVYTSNVYFLLGDHNTLDDVNTLIDVGRDPAIIDRISRLDTGVGKKRVEKVVLTHGHFDHAGLLSTIKDEFDPEIYAFHPPDTMGYVLRDGQTLKLADRIFDIIHVPGHTNDSICLYCEQEEALFSGDSSLIINMRDGTFPMAFVHALEKIARRNITAIYPGHGDPITNHVKKQIYMTLDNVRKSRIY